MAPRFCSTPPLPNRRENIFHHFRLWLCALRAFAVEADTHRTGVHGPPADDEQGVPAELFGVLNLRLDRVVAEGVLTRPCAARNSFAMAYAYFTSAADAGSSSVPRVRTRTRSGASQSGKLLAEWSMRKPMKRSCVPSGARWMQCGVLSVNEEIARKLACSHANS